MRQYWLELRSSFAKERSCSVISFWLRRKFISVINLLCRIPMLLFHCCRRQATLWLNSEISNSVVVFDILKVWYAGRSWEEIKKPPEFAAQRALLAIRSFLARVPLIPCYRGNVRTGLGVFTHRSLQLVKLAGGIKRPFEGSSNLRLLVALLFGVADLNGCGILMMQISSHLMLHLTLPGKLEQRVYRATYLCKLPLSESMFAFRGASPFETSHYSLLLGVFEK